MHRAQYETVKNTLHVEKKFKAQIPRINNSRYTSRPLPLTATVTTAPGIPRKKEKKEVERKILSSADEM